MVVKMQSADVKVGNAAKAWFESKRKDVAALSLLTLRTATSRRGLLTRAGALELTGKKAGDLLVLFGKQAKRSGEKAGDQKERLAKVIDSRDSNWTIDVTDQLNQRRDVVHAFLRNGLHEHALFGPSGAVQATCICGPHVLKVWHSQALNCTAERPLYFGEVAVHPLALLKRMLAAKVNLVRNGHVDFAPQLRATAIDVSSYAKMDVVRVVQCCDPSTTKFMRAMAEGSIGGVLIPGYGTYNVEAYRMLAWYYEQLHIFFVQFAFSRQIICSRDDPRFVNARAAFNKLAVWFWTRNPDNVARCEGMIAREPMEGLVSIMSFFEEKLSEVECINAGCGGGGVKFGIKPGRINISRIEHEFMRLRQGSGLAALTGAKAEFLFMKRFALIGMQLEGEDGGGALRSDYDVDGLRD